MAKGLIRYWAAARAAAGVDEEPYDAATLGQALDGGARPAGARSSGVSSRAVPS